MSALVLGRRVRSSFVRLLVVLAGSSVVLSMLAASPASAAQANVTLEQDWDLLSEVRTGVVTTTSLDLPRGLLPGGTSKFSPSPTATLHVVGRVTGGTGTASGWNVNLRSATGTLASVFFQRSTSGSYRIPFPLPSSASFTWPSTSTPITGLDLVPYQPAGSLAGTFDLKKAYVRIRQTGIITKTVGRVHMGAKQVNNTNGDWARLADPGIYKHDAGDFSPAPMVKLRATALATQCTIAVSLFDQTDETMVAGSDLYFTSLTSRESGSLMLTDGHEYSIRRKAIGGCGSASRSDGVESNEVDPPDAAGDFISADLVFEQATTDPAGLDKTAGFYASVTAATDLSAPGAAGNLDFLFTAPDNVFPKDSIEEENEKPQWSFVAYRRTTPGVITSVAGPLQDRGKELESGSAASSAVAVQFESPGLATTPALTSGIQPGDYLDTHAILNNNPTLPRMSWSLYKHRVQLKDAFEPGVAALTAVPERISPNDDTKFETTRISSAVSDYSAVTWQFKIPDPSDPSGEPLAASPVGSLPAGSAAAPVHWDWNGKTSSGGVLDDGEYLAYLTVTDASASANSKTTAARPIIIDASAPSGTPFAASPDSISPNADGVSDSTTLSTTLGDPSLPLSWNIGIRPASGGALVRPAFTGSSPAVTQVWDGKNGADQSVADGIYRATISVEDSVANALSMTRDIVVDTLRPTILSYSTSAANFSPNGDQHIDATTLTASWLDASSTTWRLDFANAGGTVVKTYEGSGSSMSQAWDGTDTQGAVVPEGTYSAVLSVTDQHQLTRTSSKSMVVDVTTPSIEGFAPTSPLFSPNGDDVKDSTTLSAVFQDESLPLNWTLRVRNDAESLVRTFNGSGPGLAQPWDGMVLGEPVSDGIYALELVGEDAAGNISTATSEVTVDTVEPQITAPLAATAPYLSPDGDGAKDFTLLTAAASDLHTVTWTIDVRRPGGSSAAEFDGAGGSASVEWNGKDSAGAATEGTHPATFAVTDAAGNRATGSRDLVVDLTDPEIQELDIWHTPFSPNGDGVNDTVDVDAVLDDELSPLSWAVTVREGQQQLRAIPGSGETVDTAWDGEDDSGSVVQDGEYDLVLTATDEAGNQTAQGKAVYVDSAATHFGEYVYRPEPLEPTPEQPPLPEFNPDIFAGEPRFLPESPLGALPDASSILPPLGLLDGELPNVLPDAKFLTDTAGDLLGSAVPAVPDLVGGLEDIVASVNVPETVSDLSMIVPDVAVVLPRDLTNGGEFTVKFTKSDLSSATYRVPTCVPTTAGRTTSGTPTTITWPGSSTPVTVSFCPSAIPSANLLVKFEGSGTPPKGSVQIDYDIPELPGIPTTGELHMRLNSCPAPMSTATCTKAFPALAQFYADSQAGVSTNNATDTYDGGKSTLLLESSTNAVPPGPAPLKEAMIWVDQPSFGKLRVASYPGGSGTLTLQYKRDGSFKADFNQVNAAAADQTIHIEKTTEVSGVVKTLATADFSNLSNVFAYEGDVLYAGPAVVSGLRASGTADKAGMTIALVDYCGSQVTVETCSPVGAKKAELIHQAMGRKFEAELNFTKDAENRPTHVSLWEKNEIEAPSNTAFQVIRWKGDDTSPSFLQLAGVSTESLGEAFLEYDEEGKVVGAEVNISNAPDNNRMLFQGAMKFSGSASPYAAEKVLTIKQAQNSSSAPYTAGTGSKLNMTVTKAEPDLHMEMKQTDKAAGTGLGAKLFITQGEASSTEVIELKTEDSEGKTLNGYLENIPTTLDLSIDVTRADGKNVGVEIDETDASAIVGHRIFYTGAKTSPRETIAVTGGGTLPVAKGSVASITRTKPPKQFKMGIKAPAGICGTPSKITVDTNNFLANSADDTLEIKQGTRGLVLKNPVAGSATRSATIAYDGPETCKKSMLRVDGSSTDSRSSEALRFFEPNEQLLLANPALSFTNTFSFLWSGTSAVPRKITIERTNGLDADGSTHEDDFIQVGRFSGSSVSDVITILGDLLPEERLNASPSEARYARVRYPDPVQFAMDFSLTGVSPNLTGRISGSNATVQEDEIITAGAPRGTVIFEGVGTSYDFTVQATATNVAISGASSATADNYLDWSVKSKGELTDGTSGSIVISGPGLDTPPTPPSADVQATWVKAPRSTFGLDVSADMSQNKFVGKFTAGNAETGSKLTATLSDAKAPCDTSTCYLEIGGGFMTGTTTVDAQAELDNHHMTFATEYPAVPSSQYVQFWNNASRPVVLTVAAPGVVESSLPIAPKAANYGGGDLLQEGLTNLLLRRQDDSAACRAEVVRTGTQCGS